MIEWIAIGLGAASSCVAGAALWLGWIAARRAIVGRLTLEGDAFIDPGPTVRVTLRNDGPGAARHIEATLRVGKHRYDAKGSACIPGTMETADTAGRARTFQAAVPSADLLGPNQQPGIPGDTRVHVRYRDGSMRRRRRQREWPVRQAEDSSHYVVFV